MRSTRASQAALLIGAGLGAFYEGILLHHSIAGFLYLAAWAVTLGGVVLLWTTQRGPGPLPSGGAFVGAYLVGWGAFNVVDALARHDLRQEWLLFSTGVGFLLLGVALWRMREHSFIERRSGLDGNECAPRQRCSLRRE